MAHAASNETDLLTVGLAQIAPVWLNRDRTLEKIIARICQAADQGCQLVAFGEALLPGYPFWIERTDGARFNSPIQKEIHAHYTQQAVQIEAGHLDSVCRTAAEKELAVILGCIARIISQTPTHRTRLRSSSGFRWHGWQATPPGSRSVRW